MSLGSYRTSESTSNASKALYIYKTNPSFPTYTKINIDDTDITPKKLVIKINY